jgi:hypothetical protein
MVFIIFSQFRTIREAIVIIKHSHNFNREDRYRLSKTFFQLFSPKSSTSLIKQPPNLPSPPNHVVDNTFSSSLLLTTWSLKLFINFLYPQSRQNFLHYLFFLSRVPEKISIEKMVVCWDVAPCSLVGIDRRFRGDYRPDDRGSKLLWNDGQCLLDYTAKHYRRQASLYSSPWEPEISPFFITSFPKKRARYWLDKSLLLCFVNKILRISLATYCVLNIRIRKNLQYTIILKMAGAMFAETLENLQHSMRLILESRSYATHAIFKIEGRRFCNVLQRIILCFLSLTIYRKIPVQTKM